MYASRARAVCVNPVPRYGLRGCLCAGDVIFKHAGPVVGSVL